MEGNPTSTTHRAWSQSRDDLAGPVSDCKEWSVLQEPAVACPITAADVASADWQAGAYLLDLMPVPILVDG